MDGMIFVAPAAGGRVRQPERQNRVMPATGAWVPNDAHYARLLAAGDVTKAEPPAKALVAADPPTTNTSGGGRKPRAASEE